MVNKSDGEESRGDGVSERGGQTEMKGKKKEEKKSEVSQRRKIVVLSKELLKKKIVIERRGVDGRREWGK